MLTPVGKRVTGILGRFAPYSTAISDSQQFVRRFAPSNCVRCCDSSSLATARNDGGVGSVINPEYRVHAGDSIV